MTDVKKKILIADDDLDFLEQLRVQLEARGFEVVTAESEKQAGETLAVSLPDLAIVDLMMEHQDGGFALCYHIKKLRPSLPVILVSAVTSETGVEFDATTDEERSWVKADVMLAKPIRFEQLLREIHRLLQA